MYMSHGQDDMRELMARILAAMETEPGDERSASGDDDDTHVRPRPTSAPPATADDSADPMADAPTWPGADAYDHDPRALAEHMSRAVDAALAAFARELRPLYERLYYERDQLLALPAVDEETQRQRLAPLTRMLAQLEALLLDVSESQ